MDRILSSEDEIGLTELLDKMEKDVNDMENMLLQAIENEKIRKEQAKQKLHEEHMKCMHSDGSNCNGDHELINHDYNMIAWK